jgi:hypothetical protein
MRKATLFILFLFISLVNAAAQHNSEVQKRVESNEYDVYKVVLKEQFIKPDTKQLVIHKFTYSELIDERQSSQFQILDRENILVEAETIENYNILNKESVALKNDFSFSSKVNLASDAELKPVLETFKADGSRKAYKDALMKKYETTILIRLSRVGFNKSRNQALIHVGYICGAVCGNGRYIILSKNKDGWVIKRTIPTWVS